MTASRCFACGRYHWAGACAESKPSEVLARAYVALEVALLGEFARMLRDARREREERS